MSERTYYNPRKEKKSFQFHFIVLSLLLLCITLGVFSGYRYFRVVNVVCTQDGHECGGDIQEYTSHLQDRSMFDEFSVKMLGKKVSIQKKFPQTLLVQAQNQEILTSIFLDREKQQRGVLYTDGSVQKVLPQNLSTSSATLAITDLTLSTLTDSSVLSPSMFAVYTDLLGFAKSTSVEEIVIVSPEEIEIHTPGKLTAFVSSDSLKAQLHSLQLLLVSPTIELKPARVDLRFDRPVLQYY